MENGVLTVKGERHLDAEDSNENYKRVERMNGTFYRRFSLPDTADGERIEATGSNGVLEITIPINDCIISLKLTELSPLLRFTKIVGNSLILNLFNFIVSKISESTINPSPILPHFLTINSTDLLE